MRAVASRTYTHALLVVVAAQPATARQFRLLRQARTPWPADGTERMDGVENTSNATNGRTPVISTSCRRRLGVVRRALSASSNGMAGSGGLTLHIANAQADRGSVTPTRDHRGETVGGAARLAPGIRRAWPGYKLHEKEAFLFIDESAIETMEGCAQGVATAQKLPVGTPTFVPTTAQALTLQECLAHDSDDAGVDAQETCFRSAMSRGRQAGTQGRTSTSCLTRTRESSKCGTTSAVS